MAQDPVIIVGAGHAGFQLAASLRQHGHEGGITLLSDEPVLPYQRPPLSKEYLDGKIGLDLLLMRPEAFFRDHRIDYLPGTGVSEIDRAGQTARIAGHQGRVDHLELASGEKLPADLVLVSIGVVPNGELAAAAGLAVTNGIVVNEELLTADINISAIGDCASFPCRHAAGQP